MPRSLGHVFYDRLQAVLIEAGFGVFAEASCKPYYAATMEAPFWITLLRAVFAGWLIALMVWLLPSAGSARLLVVLLLTYVVALAHLSHIIAGSVEAAYAVLDGQATLGMYFMAFLLPTIKFGNLVDENGSVATIKFSALSDGTIVASGSAGVREPGGTVTMNPKSYLDAVSITAGESEVTGDVLDVDFYLV